jgi:DNA processing protein
MSIPLTDDLRDRLALHLVPGVGPRIMQALLERFGSPGSALRASAPQLSEVAHVGTKLVASIAAAASGEAVAAELEHVERHGVRLLPLGTPEYPARLVTIGDPPSFLYVRGELRAEDANAVALVGSRHPTAYGRRVVAQLAAGLVRAGLTVVSGLARGIDGAAHRAALEAGGRTVAVLAGGLSGIYPPEHAELAKEVAASGALVTESCMLQEPIAGLFHARNRIISGLSLAVVIVEAAERSGALITASHAADQGRPVLAVPGPVDNPASAGCHDLMRKGAILCRGIDDVLEEVHGVSAMVQAKNAEISRPVPATPPPGLDVTQLRIWDFLGGGNRTMDEMGQQLGLAVPQLTTSLLMLEMRKAVRRLPGSRYERC